jgi:hypothetical protein
MTDMSEAVQDQRVVLSNGEVNPEAGIAHAAVPFMLGLVGAVIGMALLQPGMLRHGPVIVSALLIPSMIVCVGVYAWSVFNPGDPVGVIVDRAKRTVAVVQANAFATRQNLIDTDEIARAALETAYDRDGYETTHAVLTLRSGERIPLPFIVDETGLAAFKSATGLSRRS